MVIILCVITILSDVYLHTHTYVHVYWKSFLPIPFSVYPYYCNVYILL